MAGRGSASSELDLVPLLLALAIALTLMGSSGWGLDVGPALYFAEIAFLNGYKKVWKDVFNLCFKFTSFGG